MKPDTQFWRYMEHLITGKIIIDRPKGKPHSRYPYMIYPLDYGYLDNTSASDGESIDV